MIFIRLLTDKIQYKDAQYSFHLISASSLPDINYHWCMKSKLAVMKKISLLLLYLVSVTLAHAQEYPAYVLYNKDGKSVKYAKMMKDISQADIVLFGENHNNALIHWLELQVTKSMHEQSEKLALAAEMFEADDQLIINEYLAGKYDHAMFSDEVKLWKNYSTDYKPLLDFAMTNNLEFVASNIPRRYARMVYKRGIESLDSLDNDAKSYIAPLPFEIDLSLPGYNYMIESMGTHAPIGSIENMAKSQASKDATMAHFILEAHKRGNRVIHYNGAFHSNNFDGINHYLRQGNPDLTIITISIAEQEVISELEEENTNLADYIFAIPSDMTKTY